jgi:putative flippase GtrA
VNAIDRILRAAPGERLSGQLVRYGIVAGSGYLLAIALYSGELAIGLPAYPALGIAFVLNGLYNFTLVRLWAFPPSGRGAGADLGRFATVALLSLAVNYGSFAILYSVLGLAATTAQRIAILIAAPVTFFANRLWSFRGSGQSPGPATAARNESYSRM